MIVVPADRFASVAARVIASAIGLAVHERGRCTLALTGGSTPAPVYRALAAITDVPWNAVEFFFGDERAVAPDDQASNYRMARETLLGVPAVAAARVHRMQAERADREQAAREYAALLPSRLDILLLGMGGDGHTASLFPHAVTLDESSRLVVPARGPLPPQDRLTITPPVIRAARMVYVLVSGAGKATMVTRAIDGDDPPTILPVRLARHGTWLLDDPAATLLRPTGE